MTLLDIPVIQRIRRNHGLEHATIHILSQRFPHKPLAGYSTPGGFFIFGDVPIDDLRASAEQALVRMRNGERELAIHEHCGTNYVVSGAVAGGLVWLGMAGANGNREKAERLPLVIVLAILGLILSQPLGPALQARVTTSGNPGGLAIVKIFPLRVGPVVLHRVTTQG